MRILWMTLALNVCWLLDLGAQTTQLDVIAFENRLKSLEQSIASQKSSSTFSALLAGFGGSAVIIAALSGWLGKVWAERILAKEKARYSTDLESFKSKLEIQIEKSKWPMAREDALAAEFRASVEKVVLPMMSAIHSMCWLAWLADVNGNEITLERITDYDREMHILLPQISGYLTLVAAHDGETYENLRLHVKTIYGFDQQIGRACQCIRQLEDPNARISVLREMSEIHSKVVQLESAIPESIAELVRHATGRRTKCIVG